MTTLPIKIILVGDANVGKTTWVTKLRTNQFITDHHSTMGAELHQVKKNNIIYNLWDCAGNPKFRGLGDGYYIQSKGVLVFCDVTNIHSVYNISKWVLMVRKLLENIPIVIVATRFDHSDNDIVKNNIKILDGLSKSLNLQYVFVSSLNGTNLTQPLSVLSELISKH